MQSAARNRVRNGSLAFVVNRRGAWARENVRNGSPAFVVNRRGVWTRENVERLAKLPDKKSDAIIR